MIVMKMIRLLSKRIPVGALSIFSVVLIAYLSLDGNPFNASEMRLFPGADKVIHALMYLVLSTVFVFDYARYMYPRKLSIWQTCLCPLCAFVYSLLMEALQAMTDAGRTADVWDAVANCLGAVSGFLLIRIFILKWIYGAIGMENVEQ